MGLKYNSAKYHSSVSDFRMYAKGLARASSAIASLHVPPKVDAGLISSAGELVDSAMAHNIANSLDSAGEEIEATERANLELIGYSPEEIDEILGTSDFLLSNNWPKRKEGADQDVYKAFEAWVESGFDWSKTEYSWEDLCNLSARAPFTDNKCSMYKGYQNKDGSMTVEDIDKHVADILKLAYNSARANGSTKEEAGVNVIITFAVICQNEAGTRARYGHSSDSFASNPLDQMDCRDYVQFWESMYVNDYDFLEVKEQNSFGFSHNVLQIKDRYGIDTKELKADENNCPWRSPFYAISDVKPTDNNYHTRYGIGSRVDENTGKEYMIYTDMSKKTGILLKSPFAKDSEFYLEKNKQTIGAAYTPEHARRKSINDAVIISDMQQFRDNTTTMIKYCRKNNLPYSAVASVVGGKVKNADKYKATLEMLEMDVLGYGVATINGSKCTYEEGNGTPYNEETQTAMSDTTGNVVTRVLVDDHNTGAEGN